MPPAGGSEMNPTRAKPARCRVKIVTLPEEPAHHCGYPEGDAPIVKVTGGGTVRIQHNPRRGSASPYIVRVATHDKDITGPRGVACPAINVKGKP